MKKHIWKVIYVFSITMWLFLTSLVLILIIKDKEYVYIFLLICFILLISNSTYLLILEFIGKKMVICNDGVITVKRKNKILNEFYNDKIYDLIKVVDLITGELDYIIFKYEGKKRRIGVTKDNRDSINIFIKEKSFRLKKNYIYWILAFLIGF